jgi:hypothetical protein
MAAGRRLRRRQARLCRLPGGIVQGEMPPIFVLGSDGEPQIVNSRIHQNILIVDRLFGAAELRLGSGNRQQTVRIVRTNPTQAAGGRDTGDNERTDTAAPMRLRAEPPRVTRLSRKMLASVGAVALLGIGGALIYALQTRDAGKGGEELYSTDNRPTADGLAGLPRDYTGRSSRPPLPGDLGRPILDAQNGASPSYRRPSRRPPSIPRKNAACRGRSRAHQPRLFPVRPTHGRAGRHRHARPCRAWPRRAARDTGSPALSSTRPSTGRPSRRIASWRRHRPSSSRPGPSSRPRSSPASVPIFPARSPRR